MPENELLEQLKSIVGPGGFCADREELAGYLTEWRGLYQGATPLMLSPQTAREVREILALCNNAGVAVVPQGGNTGLTGGAIPGLNGAPGEILLSTRRLRQVRELDKDNYTITVEAGCVLADIQELAANYGLLFPLSLAAEGSCQIGGNISTNAGGTNVLRYGNTRELVLGLEVVMPDGSLFDGLRGLRKDNTGYDLKQLFIGAEGTLGIVTAATLKLFPQPASTTTAWVAVQDPRAAVSVYDRARRELGDELVAFELLPQLALEMVMRHIPGCRNPLDNSQPWHVLLELGSARGQEEAEGQLVGLLESSMDSGLILDGVVASSEGQRAKLWRTRHGISEAQKQAGASIKHDISVPVSRMPDFLEQAGQRVAAVLPGVRPVPFGHLGDGNLHYNLSQPADMAGADFLLLWEQFNQVVHGLAVEMGGSFSAEHGIGALKADELERLADPVKLRLMRAVKQAFDPNGIMNPGKVLK